MFNHTQHEKKYFINIFILTLLTFYASAQINYQAVPNSISITPVSTLDVDAIATTNGAAIYDEFCGTQNPDSTTVVADPWYGNNNYLYTLLEQQGFYGNYVPGARISSNCTPTRFLIPVVVWVYWDDNGSASGTFQNTAQVQEIFRRINETFRLANPRGTGIFFYLTQINFVNSSRFQTIDAGTNVSSQEYLEMFSTNKAANAVNVHFVRRTTQAYEMGITNAKPGPGGLAAMPSLPFPNVKNSLYVLTTNNRFFEQRREDILIAGTLEH